MKPAPFESTPEFHHFSNVMKKLVTVSKAELDEKVKAASSPKVKSQSRLRSRHKEV